jgi:predicted alpha/beta hydrolase
VVASRATDPRRRAAGPRSLVLALEAQAEAEGRAIRDNTIWSCALVYAVIAAAYGLRGSPRYVFLAALLLFVQQLLATGHHARLLSLVSAANAIRASMPPRRLAGTLWRGAALAVRESYLALFLCFDAAWLIHGYARPHPAPSFSVYLARLEVGPITGPMLLLFTVGFWLTYAALFNYGDFVARDEETHLASPLRGGSGASIDRVRLSVGVKIGTGQTIRINGYRLTRTGAQALILWPGFFQNGFVYDLFAETGSLAEYLHQSGFDVWIFHPRGTGGSDGRRLRASLDDYAATDVPAIIEFVAGKIAAPPILVGHSQGGITAILSLMGVELRSDGSVRLSDDAARTRQNMLRGLVTLGAFPSFVSSHETDLQRFVRRGLPVRLFGLTVRIPLPPLLALVRPFPFLGVPIDTHFRRALITNVALRWLTLPVFLVLELVGRMAFWEFLYHVPNVRTPARRQLFFTTIEGTFTGILQQFYDAVYQGGMRSRDLAVNYSEHYARLRLPVSFVAMELDGFVDQPSMVKLMFEGVSSDVKFETHIPRLGHEDFFMVPSYFPSALEGILKLCPAGDSGLFAMPVREWSHS